MSRRRATSRRQDGFFTIWVLGLCVLIFMIGGISLDLWRGFSDRRQLAAITDAASVAAASQIDLAAFRAQPSVLRLDGEGARRTATQYIATEAAATGIEIDSVQVTVDGTAVQIVATKKLNLTLSRVLNPNNDITVSTTSAAEARVGGGA